MAMNLRGYLAALGEAGAAATELTHRAPLQALLEGFAGARVRAGTGGGAIKVLHEPKGGEYGRPDFMVKQDERIIGYVEAKRPGADLDAAIKSGQIRKYNKMFANIVVTDYLEFIRLEDLQVVARGRLCRPADLRRGFTPAAADERAVAEVLTSFMSREPAGIASSKALAAALAFRTGWLRDFIGERIEKQSRKAGRQRRLYGLYETFKRDVFGDLSISEFADAFAQMLTYGLFLAKLNANGADINIGNAKEHIKSNFGLLRELLGFLDELKEGEEYKAIRWLVEEITAIMNGLDLAAVREDLSFRKNPRRMREDEEERLFAKDPYVYFYEDFLRSYDEATRESRGVYYTPPPVVNFIVRAVNHSLREDFKVKQGLADHNKVTVLDFAAGTGTFLIEVLHEIFDSLPAGKRRGVIREHVLKNIYGFEFLIAPYAIAHLKLSQFLADYGYEFEGDERLQIYLTNTLEDVKPKRNLFVPNLSEEVRLAQAAKEKPILVIIGNPPYSGESRNKNKWIAGLMTEYKAGLNERNVKWLNDDYVKFIRFAQYKMEQVEEGVVGVITNHAFLDNVTFRLMRKSLLKTFNRMYLLDLHGNSKRGETAPGGGADKNVFDIQQGVAVSIFIKKPGLSRRVMHADLWGGRQYKYRACAEHDFGGRGGAIKWREIKPASPDYYFKPVDESGAAAYEKGWRIPDIFPLNSVGTITARDDLTVHFQAGDVQKTVRKFARMEPEEARAAYGLGKDGRNWKVKDAQKDVLDAKLSAKNIRPILYRAFDRRWTYYTGKTSGFLSWPRDRVMRHMLAGDNVGLVTVRQVAEESFNHVFAGDCIADFRVTLSNRGGAYMFPLYRHEEDDAIGNGASRAENLSPAFRRFIDARYGKKYPPEKILAYIYAVLHSPAYRKKYNAFLKRDFARVPFAGKRADFEKLARLGDALLRAHLMRSVPASPKVSISAGAGAVVKVSYDARQKRLYIAPPKGADKGQYFSPLSPEVWEFRIGGYQVLEKYLKSRRGRVLSLDEMAHAEGIARVIAFTLAQMKKIDAVLAAAGE